MYFVISVVRMFEEKVAQFQEKHQKTQIKSILEPQIAYIKVLGSHHAMALPPAIPARQRTSFKVQPFK